MPTMRSELRIAEHDEPIGVQPREHALDRQEHPRLPGAVVSVKDVAVVRMHESAPARAAEKRGGRAEPVEQSGDAPDRPGLRRMRMNDVRPESNHHPPELPDRHEIAWRELPAHGGNDDRGHATRSGERAHVLFAGGDDAGHEHRIEAVQAKGLVQPDDVLCRSADVEPGDDAENADRLSWRHRTPAAAATRARSSPSIPSSMFGLKRTAVAMSATAASIRPSRNMTRPR